MSSDRRQATRHSSWRTLRFDQMATNVTDRVDNPAEAVVERYVGLEHLDTDSLTIRRWGVPTDVEATKLLFRAGDIIFGRRLAYQRKLAVADFDGICSAHAMVLRAKREVVLPEFLPFFMQSDLFMNRALDISVGSLSLSPTINWKTLAMQEFALPPLEEQRRIAELLWALEDLLNWAVAAETALDQLWESCVEAHLANLGKDARIIPVGDLLLEDPKNGYSPQTNEAGLGIRTVSIGAISRNRFSPDEYIKHAEVEPGRVSPFFVAKDDVFVVRGNGNRQLTGKCGIAEQPFDDLFYPDLLIRLRFDPTKIHPRYATYQWNSPAVHRRLVARAKSTNGIWKVNGQDVRKHTLLVPDLEDQAVLLDELDALDLARQKLLAHRKTTAELRHRLVNDELAGQT
jgi:type I restriction enzyme S subunit